MDRHSDRRCVVIRWAGPLEPIDARYSRHQYIIDAYIHLFKGGAQVGPDIGSENDLRLSITNGLLPNTEPISAIFFLFLKASGTDNL